MTPKGGAMATGVWMEASPTETSMAAAVLAADMSTALVEAPLVSSSG